MGAIALASVASAAAPSPPQIEPLKFRLLAVLDEPVDLASRSGDPRLYVAERKGLVRAIEPSGVVSSPVLDLSDRVSINGELGLLGITFSPDGQRLYANYTGGGRQSRLASWTLVGGQVDPASEVQHLVLGDPSYIHNGGQIAFGPDGFLYWAFGDGRVARNGQDPTTRRGSILRINPTPGGAAPYIIPSANPFATAGGAVEVWAYGLRNPWRFSFDRQTGDLWVADVGEYKAEEINHLPAGSPPAANFGWAAFEGTRQRSILPTPGTIAPVYEYARDVGTSVIGGFVYRGSAIPSLRGLYVFGDFGSGFVAALGYDDEGRVSVQNLPFEVPTIVSFGQDSSGELYALAISGEVYKIAPQFEHATPSSVPIPQADGKVARPPEPMKLVSIVSTVLVTKGRMLKVRLSCSRLATDACDGRLAVSMQSPRGAAARSRSTLSLASGRFRQLAAGTKRVYRLRLRKLARELFGKSAARGRLSMKITIKARDRAGVQRTTTATRRVPVSRR